MDALYIILTASLFAISCGLLGCFLILRKMAMVGDAISHAVLPGIVVAFLLLMAWHVSVVLNHVVWIGLTSHSKIHSL